MARAQARAPTFAWQAPLMLGSLLLPLAALYWLLANPRQNRELLVPIEHFVIVANVSFLALAVAVLLARAALHSGQYPVLFQALGFTSMAGLFLVHALATPGVMVPGYADAYGGTLIGLSAYLSLFAPSLFFALRYLPLPGAVERFLAGRPRVLFGAVLAALAVYGAVGLWRPYLVSSLPLSYPPLSYALGVTTVLLLAFAAWRQAGAYVLTRLPMHGALVMAYLLLVEAQVSMVLAPLWTLAWWEYHLLMLVAVVLALGALFVELDRRRGLERFLPRTVVERVLAGDPLDPAGERRVVTVLFADLRAFTTLAERLPAEAVVEVLNAYLGALARSVFAQGGMLDKFMGDGLMAIFGLLPDESDGAVAAARTVLDMRRAVDALNAERVQRGLAPVSFGVGIHTGEVVLGAVGLPERSDFTAVGDTVNTAARLEAECRHFEVDSILTAETAARLVRAGVQVRPLGEVYLRGKAEPVRAFALG